VKKEYISYTEKLGEIGEKIQKAADVFGEVSKMSTHDTEGVKSKYNSLVKANGGYEQCKQDLRNLVCPLVVENEHNELIKAVQMLIDSVNVMLSAINIEKESLDAEKLEIGFSLQKEAVFLAEHITNKMVYKFRNY